MTKKAKEETKATVRLPAELYRESRILALQRGITFQKLVETLLTRELARSGARRSTQEPAD